MSTSQAVLACGAFRLNCIPFGFAYTFALWGCMIFWGMTTAYCDSSVTNAPMATGTLMFFPEMRALPEMAVVGNDIQATYFKTSTLNRDVRRGYIELPALRDGVVREARLMVDEWRGVIGNIDVPARTYQLSFYPADMKITTNDWYNLSVPLLYFQSDENNNPHPFTFDVTRAVRELGKNNIGFQFQLKDDFAFVEEEAFGTAFIGYQQSNGPKLVVTFADRTLPSITITSPLPGQQLTAPDTLQISARAEDPFGGIQRLEFYAEQNLIGVSQVITNTTAPVNHSIVWTNISVGSHELVARGFDKQTNLVSSIPMIITVVRQPSIESTARRVLPLGYMGGVPVRVSLQVFPKPSAKFYAVEEQIPNGWKNVTNLTDGGLFDSVTGKVKFGPFADPLPRMLSYLVTPGASNVAARFSGTLSVDGTNFVIMGDKNVAIAPRHPADYNPFDAKISIQELTIYGWTWKSFNRWPPDEQPLPMDEVTRAAFIWRSGEAYRFDSAAGPRPLWWVPASAQKTAAPATTSNAQLLISDGPAGSITCQLSVQPGGSVLAFAASAQIDSDALVFDLPEEGSYESASREMRFGPFLDNKPRLWTWNVKPVDPTRPPHFIALVSIDGSSIRADLTDTRFPLPKLTVRRSVDLSIELGHAGSTSPYLLEKSRDLRSWTPLKDVPSDLPVRLQRDQQVLFEFFRLRFQ